MVYVCGDTHGTYDKEKIDLWHQKEDITEDDVLIILGDFGGVWYHRNSKKWISDNKLQRNYLKKKFETFVVDGNHENHAIINNLPIIEKYNGKVRELKVQHPYKDFENVGSIYFAIRGEIYEIQGRKILCVGGAESQDKALRTWNVDWWSEETLSKSDETNTLNNLDKHDWKVDYVLTHTCPAYVGNVMIGKVFGPYSKEYSRYMSKSKDPVSKFFDFLLDRGITFNEWHFGHWHTDTTVNFCNDIYKCHYNNFPEALS
jgi:predicted phosphodiesterase